jgi:hypothetical protein
VTRAGEGFRVCFQVVWFSRTFGHEGLQAGVSALKLEAKIAHLAERSIP